MAIAAPVRSPVRQQQRQLAATQVTLRHGDGTEEVVPVDGRLARLVAYFVLYAARLGVNELEKGQLVIHFRRGYRLAVEVRDLALPAVPDRD